MTKAAKLNVAQIDVLRAETLNNLATAREHLAESAYAAALPNGDEKAMLKARDAVNVLELKVQGLAVARKQAEQVEQEEKEASAAASRRANAVQVRLAVAEYMRLLTGLAITLGELQTKVSEAGVAQDMLHHYAFGLAHNEPATMKVRNALVHFGAFGTANFPPLLDKLLRSAPNLAPYMIGGMDRGLSALASVTPEILDEAVIAEADERLRAQFKEAAAARITKE
ncbi:hypothetical protein CVO77_03640 [Sphingopyxis lindanitolerans]|uniref:Uncharacterized protein n=1 Tax=Sphingopyxis lindanitolerans TaxID=2054227 RepID=A0A2S8B5I8_9SPHN|nr:hypothetical protein [Sphingopyxis lindanitolerans]PQM27674.1 hypothetical protein CVO77_03640 [Sphingopyxis lindanitolerans]